MPYLDAVISLSRFVIAWVSELLDGFVKGLLRPLSTSIVIGSVVDLSRSKADLIAENALLRHQVALLKRQVKRPRLKPADRLSLLVLARVTRTWRQALPIVQPATLLRWHREGFSPILEVEEPEAKQSAADLGGDDRVDSPDVGGESAMGCGAHPR